MRGVLACALLAAAQQALAAPEEIQVYTDDINAPGEFGLELHVNKVLSGNGRSRLPRRPAALAGAAHHARVLLRLDQGGRARRLLPDFH